jgi:hypothetical protein
MSAGLVDQAGNERAVTCQLVDTAVEGSDVVASDLRVTGRVGVPDVERGVADLEPDRGVHDVVQPLVLTAARVEDAHDRSASRHEVAVRAAVRRRADVRDRLPPAVARHAVGVDGDAEELGGAGYGVGLVKRSLRPRRHEQDVVEPDPPEGGLAVRSPGLLQQHPAVGRERGARRLDPDDAA